MSPLHSPSIAKRRGRVGGKQASASGISPLCPPKDPVRQFTGLQGLALCLRKSFDRLFEEAFFIHSDLETTDLFNDDQAWLVCKNYESLLTDLHLDSILGSEPLVGAYQAILGCIERWKGTESHQSYLSSLIAMQSRARDVQLEAFEKEAQKIEKAKRRKAEALAKEERELVRLEKEETKRLLDLAEKERRRVWREEQALVLERFKAEHYQNPKSVSSGLQTRTICSAFNFYLCISLHTFGSTGLTPI